MAALTPDEATALQARVDALLRRGKNVYQPLYNYPYPQIIAPLRDCSDRCAAVEQAMQTPLAGKRLWDAGCSLGYNTLYFVDRGMVGHGTDIDDRNIALCREIQIFTKGEASFAQSELSLETVRDMAPGQYDYAFFFSILHHINQIHGLGYVQDMMREITARIPVIFVELAQKTENSPPGYSWEHHLPKDDLAIFARCEDPVIDLVGRFPTHVCDLDRPLYRISTRPKP